jgi:RNA polymerase sigma-70 factor (ECF subfamily)
MAIGMDELKMAKFPLSPADMLADDAERELIFQAKNGSTTAFERLVEGYERKIFRLAQSITRHRQDAEDVVQNAFVQAFKNLPQFRGDSRFYSWLMRIAVNEALLKIRRRRRFNEVPIDAPDEVDDASFTREIEDWAPNPEQRYLQHELRRILATAIAGLHRHYWTVFQLREVEGLSTKETAQVLDLSSSAVKTRLRRARIKLRNSLNGHFRSKHQPDEFLFAGEAP